MKKSICGNRWKCSSFSSIFFMLLNIITGFSNLKTDILLTEEFPLKERLMRMKTTWIISKKENSGTLENTFEMMSDE